VIRFKSAAIAALLLVSCRDGTPAKAPERAKPELFLLTSLPLIWGEEFGLASHGSAAFDALQRHYRITAIDLPGQLPKGALLLAAQPRALPASELVKLDDWVRAGGRLVLLADPMLEWPSDLPLGDPRRPPLAFADTGLLLHWGLRLDKPEQRGTAAASIDGRPVVVASPGGLFSSEPGCTLSNGGLTAHCRIDKGQVIVIADADFLNVGSDLQDDGNLAALLSQLQLLSR
jgi:hypothetical protein